MPISHINEFFGFLNSYGFKGPYEYQYGRWEGEYYVKGKIIVDFSFDGYWSADIMKTKKYYKDLEDGKIKPYSNQIKLHHSNNLRFLDHERTIRKPINFDNDHDKELNYYSKLIKDNTEILEGNFEKFSIIYPLLRLLHIK